MKSSLSILILLLCTSYYSVYALSKCQCTVDSTSFPGSSTSPPKTLSLSPDDEVIGNTNFGKLVAVGSIQVLQKLFQVQKQSSGGLNHNCPSGYIPITHDDLNSIIARSDFSTLIGSQYLNLDFTKNTYYSSSKVYPNVTDGSNNNAYIYYTLSLDKNNKPNIDQVNTYWDSKTKSTICKKNLQSFYVSLSGYEGYDLEKGKSYQMSVTNKNVVKYYIYDNNGNKFTTQTFTYTQNGNQWGCATLNFKLELFGGVIVGDCLSIWTYNQIAFNADSSKFNINQIKNVTLPGVKANVNNGFFFSPGSAPIAPILGDSSSFYVYYSDKNSSKLFVQKISSGGAAIGSAIDTKQVGNPFDIVSTDFGFVVMASDSTQRAFIQAINKDGSQRWLRILMNNGQQPNTPKEQIQFFSDAQCNLPFGMTCMFNPHNGRLNYARGKIQAIWAHYNHFGVNSNGNRDDHTGDTMISLDADTGFNQNIFWSWGTSHSLYQNLHYDGNNLYIASLGDAYPMNINFKVCNIDTYQCKESSKVVQGAIPGNGGGSSSGRQGGFFSVSGNRNQKLFVYQRKVCNGGYAGTPSTNSVNELAVIKLDSQLNYISTTTLLSGDAAARVNSIKSVAYGKNILLAYTQIPQTEIQNFNRQNSNSKVDQAFVALLSGVDGSFLVKPTQLSTFQINSSDDWRPLENGSIAYTYIDSNNSLSIFLAPSLTIPNYPNPIKQSDALYGFGNFTNSLVQIPVNNYNNVCAKQGDPNRNLHVINSITSQIQNENENSYSFQKIINSLGVILTILALSI
ncbi:hypothetical protein TTHERM_00320150 (macronuclear) [Tetrahymena thermophila SB210]|uniref:Transmembrane protein n=1 Tax=Tetrahymena thermophila (strain SB210) TaxID=312017 RepID=Q237S2_TETTS|nr:hypothetical protein TTHERM_00320150 [Tetrahymena thermophila SB210]EAR92669.1 hypothetical protein TTHERM_00320150 [Tetrahymena thermophila SB210]|eukprot:XP_001012914.1 hypothetical protein TTHERM_00320150 [Tetrahymena thermophila SB210]